MENTDNDQQEMKACKFCHNSIIKSNLVLHEIKCEKTQKTSFETP